MATSPTWDLRGPDGKPLPNLQADTSTLLEFLGLVGVTELAEKAGVKPHTVTIWRDRHADFPAPAIELAAGPIWSWRDVEPWVTAQKAKAPGRPKAS